MPFPRLLRAAPILLLSAALPRPGFGLQTSATLRLDNDFFNFWQAPMQRPDLEYTQGGELTFRWPATAFVLPALLSQVPKCQRTTLPSVLCRHLSFGVGQDIYTPSVDSRHLLPGQRPYAGWLYVALSERVENDRRFDLLRGTIGVTGPPSLAEAFQSGWHEWFGFRKPLGWGDQLPFEPAVALSYEGGRALLHLPAGRRPVIALAPVWSLTVGTLLTDVQLGLRATIGWHAPPPWPTIAQRSPSRPLDVYLLGALRGDLVARDLFLDGTFFRSSPQVDRRLLVGQVEGGLGLAVGRARLEWTVIHRAREYTTQPVPHTYSRLLFGWD